MTPGPASRRPPRGRNDPERAARIARAARQLVEERGPGGLTHRLAAERAGVPLGSTTYHFANLQELLAAALGEMIADHARYIEAWSAGLTRDRWADSVADLLLEQSEPGAARRRLLVEHELYMLSSRSDDLRALAQRWDSVLRTTLQGRLGVVAGRTVFAVYNGLQLGSLVTDGPLDRTEVLEVLRTVGVPSDTVRRQSDPVPDAVDGQVSDGSSRGE